MKQNQGKSDKVELIVNKLIPAYFFLNRYTLLLFNLLMVAIIISALSDVYQLLSSEKGKIEELGTIMNGIGAIVVSYGIVLEEREALMQIFKCYPQHDNPLERLVDTISHDGGVILLVLGLFIEIAAQVVEIPDGVINTAGMETIIFTLGCVLLVITIIHFLNFCYRLLVVKTQKQSCGNA